MNNKISCRLLRDYNEPNKLRAVFSNLPESLRGKKATLEVELKAEVTTSGGIDRVKSMGKVSALLGYESEILLNESMSECLLYRGQQLYLRPIVSVKIDAKPIYHSESDAQFNFDFPRMNAETGDAAGLIEPKDKYSLAANLRAIPPKNRLIARAIILIGSIFLGFNTLLGLHDQMVPESQAYYYDKSGADGGESPMMKSLFGSGGFGLFLFIALRKQLSKYMSFELKPSTTPKPDQPLAASDFIQGVARVDLKQTLVRVVACNLECGQYTRREGTKTRTVTFRTPFRAVTLYEKHLAHVPAGVPIENYLDGEIDFPRLFASLYPPLMLDSHHGIDVHWEVQLIHPEFVDQERKGNNAFFSYKDFLI